MKFKHLFIYALAGMALCSCHDLNLQPLSEASDETWFADKTQVEMSLNTLYLQQFWPLFKNCLYGTKDIMAMDEATDDWTNRSTLTVFTNGTLNGNNSTAIKGTWENSYKAISRCNTILANIERSKDNLTTELYERYMGDARFVRACQYSRLISLYGDVPYFTEEISLEEAYKMGRTDKAEVLQHIYDDFDYAAQKLPVAYDGNEMKRATQGAAYAMKARIALFFKDYATARDAAKSCMDLKIYSLYPDFGELFLSKTKNSVETVFGIPRSVEYGQMLQGGAVTAYLPRTAGGTSTANPSWDLLCSFLCTDGKTIDQSTVYNPQKPFDNRDPRCTATIVPFNTRHLGFNYTPEPDSAKCWSYKESAKITNKDSKGGDQYASYNGLILKKGIDETWVNNGSYTVDPDKLIMRYADVLLMYAEAKIELNDIDQSVLDAMNTVRARAYKADINSGSYPRITETGQAALRRLLRIERRMEFAFEGWRYWDILRWRIAEDVMNRPNYGLPTSVANCKKLITSKVWFFSGTPQIDENGSPDFSTMAGIAQYRVLSQRVFDVKKQYLWPIPTDDVLINANLQQNPNY
ncbi:RagB/SusD family nutrient uptake outer membrane protein [uncultured Bacteroides sp.]|uniref:RagB/SusD family nutrient uptake outer membrane protein n=1 Tax=uncultured Bacteroides sp. TaxID=162156 RepID=UPI002AA83DAD|nr:RagB/SusD family nutrient uptake outer membrane protein [uncultured Bacteroides sp.]